MKLSLVDRVKMAWALIWSPPYAVALDELAQELDPMCTCGEDNPYVEDPDVARMMFECAEASIHALWPLLMEHGAAGLMAFRGVVHGALKTVGVDALDQNQEAMAFEVARVIHGYLSEDQSAMEMPGVKPWAEGAERVDAELIAFFGAARDGDFEDAVMVVDALRQSHGPKVFERPDVLTRGDAEHRVVTEFLGSVLASTAHQFVADNLEDDEDA